MARCSECGQSWPDGYERCPNDHSRLGEAGQQVTAGDPAALVVRPPSLPPDEFPPGTLVGEYRIEDDLGRGGAGVVYGAVHPIIGKRVAIKVLSAERCSDPTGLRRFVREARLVNQIGHPNIVDIFAFGELPNGRVYLVMEWLAGETLRQRIRRGAIPVEESAAILLQICDAMDAAHRAGVVHRDLKPANVILSLRGGRLLVKLLDFGIAKLDVSGDLDLDNSVRTRLGALLGTPGYMAPEQASGGKLDGRADIYSLGCIAFRMFVGCPAYEADSSLDLLHKHSHAPLPSPKAINPGVPDDVAELLCCMLAKAPADRPGTAEVRAVLARYADAGTAGVVAPPVVLGEAAPSAVAAETVLLPRRSRGQRRRARLMLVLAGGAVLAGLVAAGAWWAAQPYEQPVGVPPEARAKPRWPDPVPELVPILPASAPATAPAMATGVVTVDSTVAGASFYLGETLLAARQQRVEVELPASSPHELRVTAPGHRDELVKVLLTAGQHLHVEATLKPLSRPAPSPGTRRTQQPASSNDLDYTLDPFAPPGRH